MRKSPEFKAAYAQGQKDAENIAKEEEKDQEDNQEGKIETKQQDESSVEKEYREGFKEGEAVRKKSEQKQKDTGTIAKEKEEVDKNKTRQEIKKIDRLEELEIPLGEQFTEASYNEKEQELNNRDKENGKRILNKKDTLEKESERLQEQIKDGKKQAELPLSVKEIQNLRKNINGVGQELRRINDFFGEDNLDEIKEEIDRSQHPMTEEDVSKERENRGYMSLGEQIRERYSSLQEELEGVQKEREAILENGKNIHETREKLAKNKEERERLEQDIENIGQILQPTEEILQGEEQSEETSSTEEETSEAESEEEDTEKEESEGEEGDLESQMKGDLDDDIESEGSEGGEQEQTPESKEEDVEKSNLEKDKKERKKKVWDKIIKVAGGILGAKGGYTLAGGVIATGSAPLVVGMFLAGGAIFLKRKNIGKGSGKFLGSFAGDIAVTLRKMAGNFESTSERKKNQEIYERTKELVEAFFTGAAAGAGAGIVLGGASQLVESGFGAEGGVEPTEPVEPQEPEIEGGVESTGEEFESNFGELGESIDTIEQLGLNPNEVSNTINEGRLLGENLLLEGGSIAEAQNSFMEILNNTSELSNIDLGSPENTKTFLEGIYEINREVLTNGSITETAVEEIADNTVQALTQ